MGGVCLQGVFLSILQITHLVDILIYTHYRGDEDFVLSSVNKAVLVGPMMVHFWINSLILSRKHVVSCTYFPFTMRSTYSQKKDCNTMISKASLEVKSMFVMRTAISLCHIHEKTITEWKGHSTFSSWL